MIFESGTVVYKGGTIDKVPYGMSNSSTIIEHKGYLHLIGSDWSSYYCRHYKYDGNSYTLLNMTPAKLTAKYDM